MSIPKYTLNYYAFNFTFKLIFTALIALILSGCGGGTGFAPVVTGIKAQSLQYGRTATILIGGKDLRSSLVVDSAGGCEAPSFASNSSTEVLVLNCTVKRAGDLPLTIKSGTGEVIYTTTLVVANPEVTLITTKGTITAELYPASAPITVNNYLSYVGSGFYRDILFHRVIAGFVIQAGGFTAGMVKKVSPSEAIQLESNQGLSNLRGTMAMARTSVFNSATSEFYFNVADNLALDYKNAANPGYAVFGKVVQGLDVVDAIASQPTGAINGFADVPLSDVSIVLAFQSK